MGQCSIQVRLFWACGFQLRQAKWHILANAGKFAELPSAEYKDTTILVMYEGSRLSWILTTHYLVKWPHTDLVHVRPINLVVYDSLGQGMATVTADSD